MPRIDQIVEAMLEEGFSETVLLSDSPARMKDETGHEELSITLAHHQITSLVEEILPADLFADLVMMESVEFEYDHPAGRLKLRVVPGPSIWRVVIRAIEGLTFFEPSAAQHDVAGQASVEGRFEVGGAAEVRGTGESVADRKGPSEYVPVGVQTGQRTDSGTILGVSVAEIFAKREPVRRPGSATIMGMGVGAEDRGRYESPQAYDRSAEQPVTEPRPPTGETMKMDAVGDAEAAAVPEPDSGEAAAASGGSRDLAAAAAGAAGPGASADAEPPGFPRVAPRDGPAAEAAGDATDAEAEEVAEVDLSGLKEITSGRTVPQPAAGRREQPTLSLKIPSFARAEREPSESSLAGLSAVDQIIEQARASGFSEVCLAAGRPPWVKTLEGFVPMKDVTDAVDERALRSLVSGLLEPSEKRRLQTVGHVSFAYGQVSPNAMVRCTVLRQAGGTAAVFRIPLVDATDPDQLGVPEGTVQMVLGPGLVVVASPPGGGRTTTAFALGSALADKSAGLTVVVGRPVERYLSHTGPVLNIDVGRHAPSASAALKGAAASGASLVLVEDTDARGVRAAVELALSGLTVVLTQRAGSAVDAIGRLASFSAPQAGYGSDRTPLERVQLCALYQELLPRVRGGRVAVFERLRPAPSTLTAIQEQRWEMVGGRFGRTVTAPGLESSLQALLQRNVVEQTTADAVLTRRNAEIPSSAGS